VPLVRKSITALLSNHENIIEEVEQSETEIDGQSRNLVANVGPPVAESTRNDTTRSNLEEEFQVPEDHYQHGELLQEDSLVHRLPCDGSNAANELDQMQL